MRRVVVSAVVLCLFGWLVMPGLVATAYGQDKDKDKDKLPLPAKDPAKEPAKDMKEIKTKPEEIKQPKKIEAVPPPAGQQFIEQKITCYKTQLVERDVTCVVNRMIPREEKFTYTTYVPVTTDVKRLETFYVTEQKPVEYTRTFLVPVTTKEKRLIKECSFVNVNEEYKYRVLVPTTQKRTVTYCDYVKSIVEVKVPVCTIVPVQSVDCCGNCCTVCQRVVTYQTVPREVCLPVKKTKDIDVVVCVPVEKVGTRMVCKPVYTDKWIEVDVTKCVAKSEVVKGTTCVQVAQTREVMCKVTTCKPVLQSGVRTVYDCKPETIVRKVQVCETVPYTVVQRIPVITGSCCSPCW